VTQDVEITNARAAALGISEPVREWTNALHVAGGDPYAVEFTADMPLLERILQQVIEAAQ